MGCSGGKSCKWRLPCCTILRLFLARGDVWLLTGVVRRPFPERALGRRAASGASMEERFSSMEERTKSSSWSEPVGQCTEH